MSYFYCISLPVANRYMVATQFEAPDARKAFPCMDEPALRATFTVSLWHKTGTEALSNMPEYAQEPGFVTSYHNFIPTIVYFHILSVNK